VPLKMSFTNVPMQAIADLPQGQITDIECKLLYWLTSEIWSGKGAIVELGSLYGKSTVCLARGMAANAMAPAGKTGKLHAFDKWLVDDENAFMLKQLGKGYRGSFKRIFEDNTDSLKDWIVAHEGDVFDAKWTHGPIEILFIDCSISKEFHEMVFKKFFPFLRRGSIVIQQDYFFYRSYYLPLMMGKLQQFLTEKVNADTSMMYQAEVSIPVSMFAKPLADSDKEIALSLEARIKHYGGIASPHGGIIGAMLVYFYTLRGNAQKAEEWSERIRRENKYSAGNPVYRNLNNALAAV